MEMIRRSVRASFVLAILLTALAASAQTEKKPSAEAAPALPPGAVESQGVVIPGCGSRGEEELRELTTVRAENGTLDTTLEVWLSMIKVPVFNTVTRKCVDKTFAGRMYRDPSTGLLTFPGPTLRVRRKAVKRGDDKPYPGDSIKVLLKNNLPPSSDSHKCAWANAGPPLCNCKTGLLNPPQCCFQTEPGPTEMNCFHGSNTTNLHFHGAHVSPQKPQDWVFLELSPLGQEFPRGQKENEVTGQFQYEIDPLNERQPEGTHWYHPHKHGSTAEQVGNGMAGALIIEGPFDDWLQKQYRGKLVEKVMIMQQVHDLNFTSVSRVGRQFDQVELEGDDKLPPGTPMPLINGQLVPRITMNPGEIQRWRMISATMEASAQLVVDLNGLVQNPDKTMQVRQIAMDGVQFSPKNYIEQPLLKKGDPKFQLSPGNRGDFLVQAPNLPGTKLLIPYEVIGAIEKQGSLIGRVRAQTRAALDILAPGDRQPALLAVYICDPDKDKGCEKKSMTFPDTLPELPHFLRPITLNPNRPIQNVQFQILGAGDPPTTPVANGRFGMQMRVKDKDKDKSELKFVQFDPDCANFTVPLDPEGGEEWHLSQNLNANEGAPPFHVFHIHTNPFQVVGTETRQGDGTYKLKKYPEPIWQDSVTLPDNETGKENNAG
ncbi:MAG: multicopper oxidase domain-containing protein, partial [Pyrinomonadaceae bacterium]|nr:multicopper oxidase domain-containing protein [Phycisphaerales bacterium]